MAKAPTRVPLLYIRPVPGSETPGDSFLMALFGGAGQTGEGRESQAGVEEDTGVGGLGRVLLTLGCGGGVVVGTAARGLLRVAAELDNTAVQRTLALPCDLANIFASGQAGGVKRRSCSAPRVWPYPAQAFARPPRNSNQNDQAHCYRPQ